MHSTRSGRAYGTPRGKGKGSARRSPDLSEAGDSQDSDPENQPEPDDNDSDDPDDDDEGDESDSPSDRFVFAVDWCREVDAQDPYFAFQVATAEVDRASVRVRSSGDCACTCEVANCRHIAWLKDKIGCTGATPCYQHINGTGFDNLKKWNRWDGAESASHATVWELRKIPTARFQTHDMLWERKELIRDILATFFLDHLTNEFRPDIFDEGGENLINAVAQNLLVPQDLVRTLSGVLMLDDDCFRRFEDLVPKDVRDLEYFHKMEFKAEKAVEMLEQYERTGFKDAWVATGPAQEAFEHDVPWCAQTLVDIVDSINAFVRNRQHGLSQSSLVEAAWALVKILHLVVGKNFELYINSSWPRVRPFGERTIDRNLFQCLLGPTSDSGPAKGNFVISALENLPDAANTVRASSSELEAIADKLPRPGYDTPRAYVERLGRFIERLTGNFRARTSSEMSAGPSSGKRRRMK